MFQNKARERHLKGNVYAIDSEINEEGPASPTSIIRYNYFVTL